MSSNLKINVSINATSNLSPTVQNAIKRLKEFESKLPNVANQLKKLEMNNKLVRDFQASRKAIEAMHPQLTKARNALTDMQAKVKIGEVTTKQFLQARTAAEQLDSKYNKLRTTTAGMAGQLKVAGVNMHELNQYTLKNNAAIEQTISNSRRLMAQARLDRMHDSRVTRAQEKVAPYEKYGQSATRVGVGLAGAGVGTLAIGKNIMSAYAESENASIALKTAMMGANGEVKAGFDAINQLSERLGDKLPGTTADFKEMMTMLVRQGMSAKTILGGTGEAAAYLGVQLKMAPAQAAEFAAKMQDALGATEGEMMNVMDVIQKTFYLGVDSGNMLEAFNAAKVGMGYLKLEGAAGAKAIAPLIAMMDQAGQMGGAAGNAFSSIMKDAVVNNDKAKKFGLNFLDKKGNAIDMQGVFAQINKIKSLGSDEKIANAIKSIFGDRKEVGQLLGTIMSKGWTGYNEMVDKLNQQADLKKRVDESLNSLKNLQEAAGGTFTNALAEIGKSFAPEIKYLVNLFAEFSAKLRAFAAAHPGVFKAIAITAGVMSVLAIIAGTALIALGALAPVFSMLIIKAAMMGPGVGIITAAMTLLKGVVLTTIPALWGLIAPMLPIIAVVALVGTAAYLVYSRWDEIVMALKMLWQDLSTSAIAIWDGIKNYFGSVITQIKDYFINTPWAQIGTDIMLGIGSGILNNINAVLAPIKTVADSAVAQFKGLLGINSPSTVFAQLGGYTTMGMAQGISGGIPGVLNTVNELTNRVKSAGAIAVTAGAVAMSPAYAGGANEFGNGASGQAIHIGQVIIQIDGANKSPEEIAKAVEKHLRKVQSAKQTANNAKFYDV